MKVHVWLLVIFINPTPTPFFENLNI